MSRISPELLTYFLVDLRMRNGKAEYLFNRCRLKKALDIPGHLSLASERQTTTERRLRIPSHLIYDVQEFERTLGPPAISLNKRQEKDALIGLGQSRRPTCRFGSKRQLRQP